MPTIITHALLPLIAAKAFKPGSLSRRLVGGSALAAAIPDVDVVSFRLGIPYGAELGHRGASHSLMFAILCGGLAAALAQRLKAPRRLAFLFVSLSAASHGLTDMLTNGGRGVAVFWPLSDARFFWLVRPVEVSSIGLKALTDGSLAAVAASEATWILLPAVVAAVLFRVLAAPHIDLARGQS